MGSVVGGGGQETKKQEDQVDGYGNVQGREIQGMDRKSGKQVVRAVRLLSRIVRTLNSCNIRTQDRRIKSVSPHRAMLDLYFKDRTC